MPINPNIALGVQPQQQPINMLGQLGQLYALKAAKQEFEGGEAMREAYAQGGDLSDPAFRQRIMAANPKLGSQLLNQYSETLARDVKTQADSLKTIKDNVGSVNSPEAMADYLRGAYSTPGGMLMAKLVPLDKALANIPTDPKGFADYKRNFGLTADKLFESADAQLRAKVDREGHGVQMRGQDIVARTAANRLDFDTRKRNVIPGDNQYYTTGAFGDILPVTGFGVVPQPAPAAAPVLPPAAANAFVTARPTINSLVTQPNAAVQPNAVVQPGSPTRANAAAIQQQANIPRPPAKEPSGTIAGYRKTADGNLEYIPGGPADPAVQAQQATVKLDAKTLATREAAYPKVTAALKAFDAKTTKFERDINELIDNKKGLDEITGFLAGRTDLSAMSDAGRRALSLFNTITAKGGFSELQDVRNASPTGGALGNVSNQEGKQLIDSFGALSRTQSGDDLRKSLATAKSDLENLKTRMREAYDMTYEYRAGRAPSGGGGGNAGAGAGGVIDFGSLK